MVSGLVSSKTSREGLNDIDFITYEIVTSKQSPSQQFKKLKSLHFKTAKYIDTYSLTIQELSETLIQFKEESDYDLDGLIVHSDHPYTRNTSGNPDYMFAYKMRCDDDIHETRVKHIEWNVSKWGYLKPVAIIEPVITQSVTISRVTAHNARYIVDNNIGVNSIIKVTRSNDVIPYITEVVTPTTPDLPDNYYWDKNHVNIISNQTSDMMCIKLLSDFFSKLNIKHVSEATVSKLVSNGLDTFIKIIKADKKRLLEIPEFKDKSAERIYTNIKEGLKNIKLSLFLGASSVLGYGIGTRKVEALLTQIPDLMTIYKTKTKTELLNLITSVQGFSVKTATKIISNLPNADKLLQETKDYVTFESKKEPSSSSLLDYKIVISGFRDASLEKTIIDNGGKVISAVSKNTTLLIVSDKNSDSSKITKAKSLNIPVYDREEFNKFLSSK
jgi:NAD-dependent DNA ligase